MLGLMNVSTVKTLHLLREPPAFNRLALDTEDLMTLSINELENEVLASTGVRRVEDYVIACSLLGNDFLPKFPGLNIRSSGVDALLQSLRVCAKNPRFSLLEGNRVSKKGIQVLVDHLARGEESRVQTDMENKASKRRVGINENETVLNVIPKLATDKERLIDVLQRMEVEILEVPNEWQQLAQRRKVLWQLPRGSGLGAPLLYR